VLALMAGSGGCVVRRVAREGRARQQVLLTFALLPMPLVR
jgi:hypothetical protein